MKKSCIWGFGYGPPYDEAGKNRVYELSNYFGIYLITTGRVDKLICRNSNSIIFKRNAIGFFLFLVYSLWFMFFRCENILLMRKPDCYFLFFFSILLKNKIIHIFSNQFFYNKSNSDYRTHNNSKTFHFLPEVNLKKFSDTIPPEISPFVILFASAPMTKEAFENKGIEIMLKGFKRFAGEINSKLIIVWRRDRYTNLSNLMKSLISSMDLNDDALIINEEIKNMQVLYDISHITILININHLDTPNYPRSLIESLSVGRPIITSSINEISDIILEENVGSVCYSSEDSVYTALLDCYDNYHKKQLRSRHVAEIHFNINAKTKIFERIFN